MKKRYQRILAILIMAAIIVTLAACGSGKNVQPDTDPSGDVIVRVGFVYPKTGDLASFGEYTEEWTKYAVDQANDLGITIDGKKAKISLITADSMSDPKEARKAARQLIKEKNIDIMITSKTADTTVPVSEICEKEGIVCLSVDTPDEAWAVNTHKYSFHAGFDIASELNCFMAAWAQVSTNNRVGVMHPNDSEGSTMINVIPDYIKEQGYTAYDPGAYLPGQKDFTNVIRNLKTQQVEILAGVMTNADFATFYQQLEESGYLENIKVITVAKTALFKKDIEALDVEGLCTEIWWDEAFPTKSSMSGKTSTQLKEEFTKLTGQEHASAAVGYDYANIEILYAVLNAAGSLDPAKLIAAAEKLDLDTVIGKVKFNSRHYSVQPLAEGQWIVGSNGDWERAIIAEGSVEGLAVTGVLKPLQ